MINLLKFLIIITMFNGLAYAAQYAVVVVEKAIIYADQEMKSPIGYISQGSQVKVGNIPRNKQRVLPIAISGKVAYIQITDINFDFRVTKTPKVSDHPIIDPDGIDDGDSFLENNHLVINAGYFALGSQWNSLSTRLGETKSQSAAIFDIMVEHRNPDKNFSLSFNFSQGMHSQKSLAIKYATFGISTFYNVIKYQMCTFDLYGELIGSTYVSFKTKANSRVYRGGLWGYGAGVMVKVFPYSLFSFHGGLGYQQISFFGIDNIIVPETTDKARLMTLNGAKLFIGMAYKF